MSNERYCTSHRPLDVHAGHTCVLIHVLDYTQVSYLSIQAEEQAYLPQLHEAMAEQKKSSGRLVASVQQRREPSSAMDLDTINELREMNEVRFLTTSRNPVQLSKTVYIL